MPGVKDTEVYRGPEGHVIRQEALHFTQHLAVTAIGSYSRIYASRQGAVKWLVKMEAKRQVRLDKLRHSQGVILAKAGKSL
jgi:hypothetical protein